MLIYVLEDVRVSLGAKAKTVDKMTLANANPIVTLQYKDENSNEKVRHVYMKKEDVGFNKTQGILCSLWKQSKHLFYTRKSVYGCMCWIWWPRVGSKQLCRHFLGLIFLTVFFHLENIITNEKKNANFRLITHWYKDFRDSILIAQFCRRVKKLKRPVNTWLSTDT